MIYHEHLSMLPYHDLIFLNLIDLTSLYLTNLLIQLIYPYLIVINIDIYLLMEVMTLNHLLTFKNFLRILSMIPQLFIFILMVNSLSNLVSILNYVKLEHLIHFIVVINMYQHFLSLIRYLNLLFSSLILILSITFILFIIIAILFFL
jgi:hypothetical protein